jgi:hypothetical protein
MDYYLQFLKDHQFNALRIPISVDFALEPEGRVKAEVVDAVRTLRGGREGGKRERRVRLRDFLVYMFTYFLTISVVSPLKTHLSPPSLLLSLSPSSAKRTSSVSAPWWTAQGSSGS